MANAQAEAAMPLPAPTSLAVPAAAVDFAIDAAPLGSALQQFALRARITLSYAPELVAGKQSAGLRGPYSVPSGLERLLDGSDLVAQRQDNGHYILQPSSSSPSPSSSSSATGMPTTSRASTALPPLQVQAQAPPSSPSADFLVDASASARRTANASETPRTTTVIPAELIRETQATSLAEALRHVPGVAFRGADAATAPAGDRPLIRGFDASGSVYVDGVRSTGPQAREMFAVEQVEVLQGPSSVYGGRGAGGGTVNLVSKTPKDHDASSAELGLGSAGFTRGTVDVNRVLDEHGAARLNLMWQDSAKAGREQVTYRRWGVAPSVSFGLGTPTSLTLSLYHMQSADMPDYSVPYASGSPASYGAGGGTPLLGLLARDYLDGSTDIVQAEWRQRLGQGMRWRAMTQYTHVTQAFIATNPQWAGAGTGSGDQLVLQAKSGLFDVDSFIHQSELSGQSNWGGLEHNWLAGVELARERGARNAFDVRDQSGASLAGGGSCSIAYNCTSFATWNPAFPWTGSIGAPTGAMAVTTVTDTAALYVQDSVRLDPRWLLNGALRYEHFATSAKGAGLSGGGGAASSSTNTLSNTEGDWNVQLGIVHQPVQGAHVYLSWSTASNPVGGDAGVGSDPISWSSRDLAPERTRSLEAGIKLDLAPQGWAFDAALFRTIKDNARISVSRDTISGATQSVRGIELGLRGQVSADWKVFGALALLDSRIDDGGSVPTNTGHAFPLTPRTSASLWNSYRLAPQWKAGLGATWNSRIYANASNTNFVPAYARFDAMLAWQANARLSLQLNLYNLGDKRYYDAVYPVYATLAPRRWGVLTARINY